MSFLQQQFQQLFSCSTTPQPSFSPPRPHSGAAGFTTNLQQSPEFMKFPWGEAANARPIPGAHPYSGLHHPSVPDPWLHQTRQTVESSQYIPASQPPSYTGSGPAGMAQNSQWPGVSAVPPSGGANPQSFRGHPVEAATLPVTTRVASRPDKTYNPNTYTGITRIHIFTFHLTIKFAFLFTFADQNYYY